jgi:hypothetical protein
MKMMLLVLAMIASVAVAANADSGSFAVETYSGYFVSNKFEPDAAASFVVINNQARFDEVFGTAYVMHDKSHRLAADTFKSKIVAAVIHRGNATWEFKVDGATVKDGVAQLRYTASATNRDTASFACPLIVSLPAGDYHAVQFVENGKPVKKVPK